MNTYNWTISALDCKANNEDNLQDVIYNIHWRYNATNENGISAESYGSQGVGTPDLESFTPYSQITKEQVIEWLEASIDISALKSQLDNQIKLIINPIDITPALPFEN